MEIKIRVSNGIRIAEILSEVIILKSVQDALDIMGNADYKGARRIILNEKNIDPSFFDLSTGLAGEILQKYTNYAVKLAIIGEFEKYNSKSLKSFIIECNRGNMVFFRQDIKSAILHLTD